MDKRIKRESNRSSIPFHIVMEILLKLPTRSLVKFRQVCKPWRFITQDPDFIETHLERARKDRPPSILLLLPDNKRDRFGITILDNSLTPNQILSRPKLLRGPVALSGPCNGLLCNSDENGNIELMNPATGESLTLPEPTMPTQLPAMPFLGFHPATKEYKVVHFFPNLCISDESLVIGLEVYTLGASSWRHICNLDYLPSSHGPVVKGAMYWRMIQCSGNEEGLSLHYHHLKSGRAEEVYHDDGHLFEPFVHVESLVALGDRRLL